MKLMILLKDARKQLIKSAPKRDAGEAILMSAISAFNSLSTSDRRA